MNHWVQATKHRWVSRFPSKDEPAVKTHMSAPAAAQRKTFWSEQCEFYWCTVTSFLGIAVLKFHSVRSLFCVSEVCQNVMLPGGASGFTVGARWHPWDIFWSLISKDSFAFLFTYLRSGPFIKFRNLYLLYIKMDFKQHLCIYLKIMKSVMFFHVTIFLPGEEFARCFFNFFLNAINTLKVSIYS